MIGKPRARVPDKISIDLGIADIFVEERGRSIRYEGKGLETDVGARMPSLTKGMSIPAIKGVRISPGSIAWKQGMFWKYLTPPWTQAKLATLKQAPTGAVRTDGRTPEQTIQMIGDPGTRVPKTAEIDLGIFKIRVSQYGKEIKFIKKGIPATKFRVAPKAHPISKRKSSKAKNKKTKQPDQSLTTGWV